MEQMPAETEATLAPDHTSDHSPIVVVPTMEGLGAINHSATSLAIWERAVPSSVYDWLAALPHEVLPRGRVLVGLDQIDSAVESLFECRQLQEWQAAQSLAQDITRLALLFAATSLSDEVDIRLDVIRHDACQKFHLDNVALRLVTTYTGESTQYVLPAFSARALEEQQAYTGPLERLSDQAVAIFKGSRCGSGNGVVHRSPPISDKNQTRLFLCINTPSQASPARWQPND